MAIPEKPIRFKLVNHFCRNTLLDQIFLAFRLIEQAHDVDNIIVIDRGDHIGILDIVDPRHVLVANTFNAVCAKAVLQQGRALQSFAEPQILDSG